MENGYNIYWYFPNLNHDLHTATFRGNEKDFRKIAADSKLSVYKKAEGMTPLFVALAQNHSIEIIDELYNIHKTDLDTVYESKQEVNIDEVVIALRKEQIEKVKKLFMKQQKVTDDASSSKFIVLLKKTNNSKGEVINIMSNDESIELIKELKQNGNLKFNENMQDGDTIVHLVAFQGYKDICLDMIKRGIWHNIKNVENLTPFAMAAKNGQKQILILINENFPEFDILDEVPALEAAAKSDQFEVFQFIYELMVNERQQRFNESYEEAIDKILTNEKAYFENVNFGLKLVKKFKNKFNLGKLLWNCVYNAANQSIALEVIEMDPKILWEVEDVQHYGVPYTAFHTMVWEGWTNEIKQVYQKYPESKSIMFKSPTVGYKSIDHGLISKQLSVDAMKYLIAEHLEEIIENKFVHKIIESASRRSGYVDVLKLLVPHLQMDEDLSRAIMNAVIYCNFECFNYLLETGKCNKIKDIQDENGNNILYHAIEITPRRLPGPGICCGIPPSKEKKKRKTEQLHNVFDILLNLGVDINHKNNEKRSLVHHAVYAGNLIALEKLLSHGAIVNVLDDNDVAPIHLVLSSDILNTLIKYSSGNQSIIHQRDGNGDTALHYAVRELDCNESFLTELLKIGADVNVLNTLGRSPLFYARRENIKNFLVKNGADRNIKDKDGNTFKEFKQYP